MCGKTDRSIGRFMCWGKGQIGPEKLGDEDEMGRNSSPRKKMGR